MGGDGGYYAPQTYSPVWLLLGVASVLAVLGWYVAVWWRTRALPPPPPPPPLAAGERLARLQADCLGRIDDLVQRVEGGLVSQRVGHQQLSAIVRDFAQAASGVSAPTMTLTELGRSDNRRLGPVTDVVLLLYPVEFGPDRSASVAEVAVTARQAVRRWS